MNNYIKQKWSDYDESKTYEENKKNYAILAPEYLNHMEDGIYKASDKTNPITNVTVESIQAGDKPTANLVEGTLHLQIPKGEKGEQGEPGQDGINGQDGENGKSAYELAVENGFEGNISEWLESLKGEKGDPGQDGQNGFDGKSAYDLAIEKGLFTGTVEEYLEFIKGRDGENGITPTIDEETNHWYIGNTDTGIKAVIDPLEYTSEESGLEDTPVGHIISHIGTTAPKHYLICDGTIYNISDYPKLAEHFRKDFGKVNQFGGDGTTTFAVPDLRGEFLRGIGTNSHENQGSGSDTVAHQDASEILYLFTGNEIGARKFIVPDVTKYDSYTKATGESIVGNARVEGDYNSGIATTRPTNTSVLYCIKCEPTYYVKLDPKEIYSLEEREVGTWINGEPLYQKTIIIDNIPASTGSGYIVPTNTFEELGIPEVDFIFCKLMIAHWHNNIGHVAWLNVPICDDSIIIDHVFNIADKIVYVYIKYISPDQQVDKIIATCQYTKN